MLLFIAIDFCDFSEKLFIGMFFDIPLVDQMVNEQQKRLCFFRINLNDRVDVCFHMGADISDLTNAVDGIPFAWRYLILNSRDFMIKSIFGYSEYVTYHPLKTTASERRGRFGANINDIKGFFEILTNCFRNVVREDWSRRPWHNHMAFTLKWIFFSYKKD